MADVFCYHVRMSGSGYIVDFNMSDGLAPGVVQKLNFNFKNAVRYGSSDGLSGGSGGGFYNDVTYESLPDKPSIEGVTLQSDKTFEELTLFKITNSEIEDITAL